MKASGKKRQTLRERARRLSFDKKLLYFMESVIVGASLLILISVTAVSGATITEKSTRIAMTHLESVAGNMQLTLGNLSDTTTLIIADNQIQQYLRLNPNLSPPAAFLQSVNATHEMLTSVSASKGFLSYVSVIKYLDDSAVYVGETWTNGHFTEMAQQDYERGIYLPGTGLCYTVTPKFFYPQEYSLNVYQKIYDKYSSNQALGLLCLSIGEDFLRDIYESYDSQLPLSLYLCDRSGKIISSGDRGRMFTVSEVAERLRGDSGSFRQDGSLFFFRRVEPWGWYLVGSLPTGYLLADTYRTFFLFLLLIAAICLICTAVSRRFCQGLYRPLGTIVQHMEYVAGGDLRTRVKVEDMGEDIRRIGGGFNDMLDKIGLLMEQVKQEQHELEQIKFNALQSQIKPHFLYNTLECIHWQAAVNGDNEVSRMVLALANFYRLCLSRGKDIIPLSQELEHVRNYLIIQNMRYDNIIESDIQVEPAFENLPIPKMTLQPLVENAIYHGIKIKDHKRGTVAIRAQARYNEAVITVFDSGTGMPQEKIDEMNRSISRFDESFGYGVRNVHRRIEILFGKGYGLRYLLNETGGVTVEIHLPRQTGGEDV